jgi:hypothetical protein
MLRRTHSELFPNVVAKRARQLRCSGHRLGGGRRIGKRLVGALAQDNALEAAHLLLARRQQSPLKGLCKCPPCWIRLSNKHRHNLSRV